jgi:hypothetical protein
MSKTDVKYEIVKLVAVAGILSDMFCSEHTIKPDNDSISHLILSILKVFGRITNKKAAFG